MQPIYSFILEKNENGMLKKLKDIIKKKVNPARKQEVDFLNKYADNKNIDKKYKNAWCLVITKENICTHPGEYIPKFYYIVNEKDTLEENKALAANLWDSLHKKHNIMSVYELIVKNPKYDPYVRNGLSSKTGEKVKNFTPEMEWSSLTYLFELSPNFSLEALNMKIKTLKSSGIKATPTQLKSFDEIIEIMKRIENKYRKIEKETEEFLNTPLDKIDNFIFKIKPEDIDI